MLSPMEFVFVNSGINIGGVVVKSNGLATSMIIFPAKSVLATNSAHLDKIFKLNNEIITAIKKDELFKYLKTWFSLSCNPLKKQKIIMCY